ncbi:MULTISPECIES: recombinase family protein [unclassified Rhizobium]|uniref:recombinase family protein n=1 Tax=unclassified Rhizobium TaxID=2613769 RepID=UPI001ADC0214|nr:MULTISPECIES: recombinase family protein [unclassified Rhizobium]MBO9102314.1 recombinase family protein [Rhizobium sp. L58/93]MBO9169959.1 recombinase family protein [Rhizobium sp. L245/93]MBO9188150.1 recombinase family protein [Rhizobium sp. E27B/91]QXZ82837.1 recombinase family protein [Rhizobium sp. K1/93]QXZ89650.1 recombinase family protein [Rhizobium sp. K15/93]
MLQYVRYTRVSTARQGQSGLGLEAQDLDIDVYLKNYSDMPYEVKGSFKDIESGTNDDRLELQKALNLCRKTGAVLLVAKLDRLSRKVARIATLMEDKRVKFAVANLPRADKAMLHMYAVMAEMERDFISARTKAALAVAKTRGSKLGGLRDKTMKRNEAIQDKAAGEAKKLMTTIGPMRDGGATLAQIAASLNSTGVKTSRGGVWTATQVSRVIERGRGYLMATREA